METKRIRTLIVDDEPLARRTIRDLLQADPEIEIVGECSDGLDAVRSIRKQTPDLLFLDIQMPGMNGFDVLAGVEDATIPVTVFVTAFDKYALKAFNVHALDYLLKPFSDQRFKEALLQAKTQVELREMNKLSRGLLAWLKDYAGGESAHLRRKNFLTRFMIRRGGRVFFIKASDVDWISAENYYINLHVSGKSHLLRISMNEIEEQLDPHTFLRIHRSTIVNFDSIKELHQNPNGDYVVVLKNGMELKLSRSRRGRIVELLRGEHE